MLVRHSVLCCCSACWRASRAALAIRGLLQAAPLPVVTTFQATGILTRELLPLFARPRRLVP